VLKERANVGIIVLDHFADVSKMVRIGSKQKRNIKWGRYGK
jgi:hypothetical protein